MPSLLEIRNKIKATKGTKKITKAMQLVAASKMKSFQKTSLSVREYTKLLLESLEQTGTSLEETFFAEQRTEGKTLFVLLTSDKGLCGAMNSKLIRTTFRSPEWTSLSSEERLLITVGKKSAEAARTEKIPTIASFAGLKEKLETIDALVVIHEIARLWKEKEIKKVILIAPEYVNAFTFNIRTRKYLPINQTVVGEDLMERTNATERLEQEAALFEPDQEVVAQKLSQQVMESLFIEAFFELKATEYSSRMVAMKKATEAADDKIKVLTNLFNKARQSAITQQLSELAAANEAMSSEHMYETNEI